MQPRPDVVETWRALLSNGTPPSIALAKAFFGLKRDRDCRGEAAISEEVDSEYGLGNGETADGSATYQGSP